MPQVSLISCTNNAEAILIFTKNTRLNMMAARFDDVTAMPYDEKLAELRYMSRTIPSSWEFVDYIFAIEGVTRAFTHQFVRNRTGSYAQQSMRVTNMGGFEFATGPTIEENLAIKSVYSRIMEDIGAGYIALNDMGAAIEDARGVLPTNIKTNIVAKYNLRTMSDLCRTRTGGRTQGEFREVIGLMSDAILGVHPWASDFLFSHGRDFFRELEEAVTLVDDFDIRQDIRKAIDAIKKELT